MKPIPFPEQNIVYVSPKNWDVEKYGPCGDLPVYANNEEKTVTSCWEFSVDDFGKLSLGGRLYLTIHGGQPPVLLEIR